MKLFKPEEIATIALGLVSGWEIGRSGSSVPIVTPQEADCRQWDIAGFTLDLATKETGIKAIIFRPKGKIEVEF